MATHQSPRVPPFATGLDPGIVQLHSSEYRSPTQLQQGNLLVVGAGNSGAEIALEAAHRHSVWLSGRGTGHIPFRIDSFTGRLLIPLVLRFLFHRVLTMSTPIGRKVRSKLISHGHALIRVKPDDLAAAGVERVATAVGARDGLPELADGSVLEAANVIWCTGFDPDFSWIDLPVFGENEPMAERGVVATEPGLFFVGLLFLYAAPSTMIHGVDRDAEHVVEIIASRRWSARLFDSRSSKRTWWLTVDGGDSTIRFRA